MSIRLQISCLSIYNVLTYTIQRGFKFHLSLMTPLMWWVKINMITQISTNSYLEQKVQKSNNGRNHLTSNEIIYEQKW